MSQTNELNDKIESIVIENLALSPKKASTFAKKARALQRNIALRKKQMQERNRLVENNSQNNGEA